jgi:hypothetical protein
MIHLDKGHKLTSEFERLFDGLQKVKPAAKQKKRA